MLFGENMWCLAALVGFSFCSLGGTPLLGVLIMYLLLLASVWQQDGSVNIVN